MVNTSQIPPYLRVGQPETALVSTSRTGSFNYTLIRIVLTKLTLYRHSSSTNNLLIAREGRTAPHVQLINCSYWTNDVDNLTNC